MFTYDEARSLLLAGKLVEKQTDQLTNNSFLNALTKVRAVLDTEKKDDLEGLDQKIIVNPFSIDKLEGQDLRINAIKQVLSENRVIKINYLSADQESCRIVESLGLVYYSNKWHLIGWCRLRKDYRDFRLDRIQDMEVLSERFLRINHMSLGQYLEKLNNDTELITLVIKVHNSLLKYIQDSKYGMGLIKEEIVGEYAEMTFASFSVDYFSRWMLMLGTKALVVSPKELQDKVKDHTLSLYKLYHSS
jgi:predicted DNA-binding transcriptional regulator YafY